MPLGQLGAAIFCEKLTKCDGSFAFFAGFERVEPTKSEEDLDPHSESPKGPTLRLVTKERARQLSAVLYSTGKYGRAVAA